MPMYIGNLTYVTCCNVEKLITVSLLKIFQVWWLFSIGTASQIYASLKEICLVGMQQHEAKDRQKLIKTFKKNRQVESQITT